MDLAASSGAAGSSPFSSPYDDYSSRSASTGSNASIEEGSSSSISRAVHSTDTKSIRERLKEIEGMSDEQVDDIKPNEVAQEWDISRDAFVETNDEMLKLSISKRESGESYYPDSFERRLLRRHFDRQRIAHALAKKKLDRYDRKVCCPGSYCEGKRHQWQTSLGTTFAVLIGVAFMAILFEDIITTLILHWFGENDGAAGNSSSTTGAAFSTTVPSLATSIEGFYETHNASVASTTTTTAPEIDSVFHIDLSDGDISETDFSFILKLSMFILNFLASRLSEEAYKKAAESEDKYTKMEDIVAVARQDLRDKWAQVEYWNSRKTSMKGSFARIPIHRFMVPRSHGSTPKLIRDIKERDRKKKEVIVCCPKDPLANLRFSELMRIDRIFQASKKSIGRLLQHATRTTKRVFKGAKLDLSYPIRALKSEVGKLRSVINYLLTYKLEKVDESEAAKRLRFIVQMCIEATTLALLVYEAYLEVDGQPNDGFRFAIGGVYTVSFIFARGGDCVSVKAKNAAEKFRNAKRLVGAKRYPEGIEGNIEFFEAVQRFSNTLGDDRKEQEAFVDLYNKARDPNVNSACGGVRMSRAIDLLVKSDVAAKTCADSAEEGDVKMLRLVDDIIARRAEKRLKKEAQSAKSRDSRRGREYRTVAASASFDRAGAEAGVEMVVGSSRADFPQRLDSDSDGSDDELLNYDLQHEDLSRLPSKVDDDVAKIQQRAKLAKPQRKTDLITQEVLKSKWRGNKFRFVRFKDTRGDRVVDDSDSDASVNESSQARLDELRVQFRKEAVERAKLLKSKGDQSGGSGAFTDPSTELEDGGNPRERQGHVVIDMGDLLKEESGDE